MADKCLIFGSPLGMYSMLRDDYIISIIDDNGNMDEKRLTAMVQVIANQGANALRDFFWIDSEHAYKKIAPFWEEGGVKWNDLFFQNQRRIAEICQAHGIRYYLNLFDHCGTKVAGAKEWNPWRFFPDFFYNDDNKTITRRHQFIDRVIEALSGLHYGLEICNEPKPGQGEFLCDTFVYLVKEKKLKPDDTVDRLFFILGNDYHLKEKGGQFGKDYIYFRKNVQKRLGEDRWDKWIKSKCISPVHGASRDSIHDLWGKDENGDFKVRPGGDRTILYSMDGYTRPNRPDKNTMFQITNEVLEVKHRSRKKKQVHFEVVFGKQEHNPMDSISGVSDAYKEIFGNLPENFGKFPEARYPIPFNNQQEPPETEPGKPGPPVGNEDPKEILKKLDDLTKQVAELKTMVLENQTEIAALKKKRIINAKGVWTA